MHRFNKAQQDAFLPYLEDGTLTFIGATTENPSFEIVSALLSRARVYVLGHLPWRTWSRCCAGRARATASAVSARQQLGVEPEALELIAHAADGDARRALDMLELAAGLLEAAGRRARSSPVRHS